MRDWTRDGEQWKLPKDGEWTHEMLEWFRLKVWGILHSADYLKAYRAWQTWPEDARRTLAWMCANPTEFVAQVAQEKFWGEDFQSWYWVVRENATIAAAEGFLRGLEEGRERVKEERERAKQAAQFPTLDAWLEAERAGQLLTDPPEEKAAYQLGINNKKFWAMRLEVRRNLKHVCRNCAGEFTRKGRPGRAVVCLKCDPKARRKKNDGEAK